MHCVEPPKPSRQQSARLRLDEDIEGKWHLECSATMGAAVHGAREQPFKKAARGGRTAGAQLPEGLRAQRQRQAVSALVSQLMLENLVTSDLATGHTAGKLPSLGQPHRQLEAREGRTAVCLFFLDSSEDHRVAWVKR